MTSDRPFPLWVFLVVIEGDVPEVRRGEVSPSLICGPTNQIQVSGAGWERKGEVPDDEGPASLPPHSQNPGTLAASVQRSS